MMSVPKIMLQLATVLLVSAAVPARVFGYSGPSLAFEATYSVETAQGVGSLHQASDGRGLFINDAVSAKGDKFFCIVDFKKGMLTQVLPSEKKANQTVISPMADSWVKDEDHLDKKTAQDLGVRTIDGHSCHGWRRTTKWSDEIFWYRTGTNYMVFMAATRPTKMRVTLKRWSKGSPPASTFMVPAGYKIEMLPTAENIHAH